MTPEKVKEVLTVYEDKLTGLLEVTKWPEMPEDTRARFEHMKSMCGKTKTFVDENRMEKAFRWLGFLQGAFWCTGIYTIEEMAKHNMPPGTKFKLEINEINHPHDET